MIEVREVKWRVLPWEHIIFQIKSVCSNNLLGSFKCRFTMEVLRKRFVQITLDVPEMLTFTYGQQFLT